MTEEQIINVDQEIEKTKSSMNALLDCAKDRLIPVSERKVYYSEYLQMSSYYLKLQQSRSTHNFNFSYGK
jgi:hypothetical protein